MNWHKVRRGLLIVGVLIVAGVIAKGLASLRKAPPIKPAKESFFPAEVMGPQKHEGRVTIETLGTLIPSKEVSLQAEVAGLTTEVSPDLVPGGLVVKDAQLVQIDRRDYKLAIKQRRADVERARVAVEQEESRGVIAQREWELLGADVKTTDRGRRLALREPQLKNAKAGLASARSALEKAELNLTRTQVHAPFNAVVRTEKAEVGQRIAPGQTIAALAGTDMWWVQVSIPLNQLPWIEVPGSNATIIQLLDEDHSIKRQGRVVRILPDVDRQGMTARLVVEVDDPLGLASEAPGLLLGTTISVHIEGRKVSGVHAIPRNALRGSDRVWLADEEDRLSFRTVEVVWRERQRLLVKGLDDNARIISSRIGTPIPGMKLQITNQGAKTKTEAKKTPISDPVPEAGQ